MDAMRGEKGDASFDAVHQRGVAAAQRLGAWIERWEELVRLRCAAGPERKADLYARAQAAGVPGRSRMSKAELGEALRRAER